MMHTTTIHIANVSSFNLNGFRMEIVKRGICLSIPNNPTADNQQQYRELQLIIMKLKRTNTPHEVFLCKELGLQIPDGVLIKSYR